MGKKTNRSNSYQHLFAEQSYSNEMMSEFSEAQGLIENYTLEDKEQLMNLREELKLAFWRLAKDNLTQRQFQVLQLLSEGFSQQECAHRLNINQSSITKSINGNCDYSNSKKKVYGGCKKKMRKLAENDEQIQKLFIQIAEIHSQY
jgi:DNA-binding CsgD family transcriptional regulator